MQLPRTTRCLPAATLWYNTSCIRLPCGYSAVLRRKGRCASRRCRTDLHRCTSTVADRAKDRSTRTESSAMVVGLSSAEKSYIAGGIAVDLRGDGRGRHHFREFCIDTSIIPQSNGSARIRLGGTDVIASVKAELGTPPPGRPNHGKLDINVECSPTAAPEFEGRGGEELSMDLSRALQRSFVGGASGAGAAIDLAALSILEGKLCWTLYIDGLVLSSDGNLLDALSIAIKAALSNCGLPKVEIIGGASPEDNADFELSENPEEFTRLDTSRVPVIVTLTKVGKHYIVDATAEEETQMTAAVSVAVNRKGSVCGLTKRGGTGLDPSVLLDMISVAKRVSQSLIINIDAEIVASENRQDDQ